MNYILTFITGLFVSLMIFFNGSLQQSIGTELSLFFIHGTALSITFFSFFKKKGNFTVQKDIKKNPFFLTAGLLGIMVVILSNTIFSKGGVLLTLTGTLTGQSIFALTLEFINKKRVSIGKIAALLLVVSGSILLGILNNLTILWILISWCPGYLLFVQSYFNSKNVEAYGSKITLLFHFGMVIVVLIPFILFKLNFNSIDLNIIKNAEYLHLFGGGTLATLVIFLSSHMFLRLKPMTFVLIMNIGQLLGAVCIDYFTGIQFSTSKLFVMLLTVSGFIFNEIGNSNLIKS